MKKLMTAIILASLTYIAMVQPVAAHVFISDPVSGAGAVVHIQPDDDPIAGQPSTFYFELQNLKTMSTSQQFAAMIIQDGAGETTTVPVAVNGMTATASYVFPTQDSYRITLEYGQIRLEHTQRVTRGTVSNDVSKPSHAWAEVTLVASLVLLALLVVVCASRSRQIREHSQ